jgi:hypothetical protein
VNIHSDWLSIGQVFGGGFDVYLTTYETVLSTESFFTDNFPFHTITIDEGHRIKNENRWDLKPLPSSVFVPLFTERSLNVH